MRLLIQTQAASQNRFSHPDRRIPHDPKRGSPLIWIVLLVLVSCVVFSEKPFITITPDGKPQLAKWRKKKLYKELKELDEAEQYALLALSNGHIICYSCPSSNMIYLNKGEVYKYGYTTKSEKGRYPKDLAEQNLFYMIQFEGSISNCMKEEKRKIYFYAILPENLARPMPLIRPPGNKQDN